MIVDAYPHGWPSTVSRTFFNDTMPNGSAAAMRCEANLDRIMRL